MALRILLDEHVPRLLETTLTSNGYATVRATEQFGEQTDDESLLEWCRENDHVLLTNDRKDFARLGNERGHSGVFLYTDDLWVRDRPNEVVRVVDAISSHFDRADLEDRVVWLESWRENA